MKLKLIDHVIISADSLTELQKKVQDFQIKRGGGSDPFEWYPSGSPLIHKDASGTFHQAMYGVGPGVQSAHE